eukprot:1188185-Rhodomonas_salina.1
MVLRDTLVLTRGMILPVAIMNDTYSEVKEQSKLQWMVPNSATSYAPPTKSPLPPYAPPTKSPLPPYETPSKYPLVQMFYIAKEYRSPSRLNLALLIVDVVYFVRYKENINRRTGPRP